MEKYTVLRSQDDGEVYCIRHLSPRFTAKYTPGDRASNIEFLSIEDEPLPDPIKLAKLMRGIGEEIARFLKDERKA